ncbi:MAG TPA: twin-arginine translocase subunit TatC [Arachnia sp.]|jgi:sec-independent protein translocase protein TatC|nr:twin-arginine translocase subunit TatC [Arachnia sp.]
MSLTDHLRELRYRVTVASFAIVVGSVACIFFYRELIGIIMGPYYSAVAELERIRPDAETMIVNDGVVSPFTLAVIACVSGGIVLSSPVWLYQLWAFVAPGLVAQEKKYALGFIGAALPLFLGGAALGYFVWPKGITVLLSFTPQDMDIVNLLEMSSFLSMELKVILVFGLSFLLPVVLVGLNIAGVVRGYQLKRARKFVMFGSVVFAAIATPSTDPFSMLALAVPLSVMFYIAEIICRSWDRRRGITEETAAEFAVDLDDGK